MPLFKTLFDKYIPPFSKLQSRSGLRLEPRGNVNVNVNVNVNGYVYVYGYVYGYVNGGHGYIVHSEAEPNGSRAQRSGSRSRSVRGARMETEYGVERERVRRGSGLSHAGT